MGNLAGKECGLKLVGFFGLKVSGFRREALLNSRQILNFGPTEAGNPDDRWFGAINRAM